MGANVHRRRIRRATVLVTGGTRGIGAGIARGFLRAGARVLVCGRTEPAELPCAGGRTAFFTRADIRDPEQAAGTVRKSLDLFHRLDVVVSNAGGSPYAARPPRRRGSTPR